ncbi:MAG: hypothetical protein A2744_04100 [Candidatus Buchananbacteria bacterium RIFCSPHIGHO2_01_FULL_44_11]|uniref:Uncharacterized protein n=1 Tax=Candidatus Buchananbacteria bacterium RIFCSPHIGHO2_01_FULL_44_11 TaxID=1797535 RepID=A0A1G1Y196_9BACT|nr:MAG: hypothetical protein A2744_04100 [Candidatus Buchananbacteria bacterium RIFCSPHIGHO2_01_FULL_44_11]
MKKSVIFALIIVLVLALAAAFFFVVLPQWQKSSYKPVTLSDYLNSKQAEYLALDLSEGSLAKVIEQILKIEAELKINPNDYQNWVQVGVLYQRLHEYDLAKKSFEVAAEILPGEGLAFANLAELYVFNFKDFDQAVENYKKAIANDYWQVSWYRSLADLYRSKFPDKISEIEPLMLQGVEKNPGTASDYYGYLLTFFWEQGEFQKALDYGKKLLALDPNNDKYQQAIKDLEAELAK